MKTTIDLPDELLIEAKKRAAEERTSLRKLVTRGLRQLLDTEKGTPAKGSRKIRFVTVEGGLPPGLDVSDRAAMHRWLRERL
jgi:hypothetical protein